MGVKNWPSHSEKYSTYQKTKPYRLEIEWLILKEDRNLISRKEDKGSIHLDMKVFRMKLLLDTEEKMYE